MTIKKFMIPLDIITMTQEEFESETSLIAEYVKDGEVIYGQQGIATGKTAKPQIAQMVKIKNPRQLYNKFINPCFLSSHF